MSTDQTSPEPDELDDAAEEQRWELEGEIAWQADRLLRIVKEIEDDPADATSVTERAADILADIDDLAAELTNLDEEG